MNRVSEQIVLVSNKLIWTYDQLNEIYCTGKCLNLNTGRFGNLFFGNLKSYVLFHKFYTLADEYVRGKFNK